jgi:DDE domain
MAALPRGDRRREIDEEARYEDCRSGERRKATTGRRIDRKWKLDQEHNEEKCKHFISPRPTVAARCASMRPENGRDGRAWQSRRRRKISEVLDVLVQSKRNMHAALKLIRKLLRKYAVVPYRLVTDDLRSCRAATLDLGIERRHERAMEEQSGRDFASADSTAGAQDATLQERGFSPEVSLNPRRRLQHFQRPTSSHLSSISPRATRRGDDHVARGRRGGLKIRKVWTARALRMAT